MPIIVILLSVACSGVESSDFYEVEGLVSGALNDTTYAPEWDLSHHINSRGLKSGNHQNDRIGAGPLSFTVYISNPGDYSLWLLAAPDPNEADTSIIGIQITAPDGFLAASTQLSMPDGVYLRWHQAQTQSGDQRFDFEQPGRYRVSLRPRDGHNVQIHKVQMSVNDVRKPFGLGYPSSVRTDLTAADLFREEPVMLPPAWVFEPVVGTDHPLSDSRFTDSLFLSGSIYPGGIWTKFAHDSTSIIGSSNVESDDIALGINLSSDKVCGSQAETIYERGYNFIVSERMNDIECIRSVHQTYQKVYGSERRPVTFHGIENTYLPESKQYPAPMTQAYQFEWSLEPEIRDGKYQPGGYQELVRDVSDPANSFYGIPFLSMPVDLSYMNQPLSENDRELFSRMVQLTPFLPVMHLILPGSIVTEGDGSAVNRLSQDEIQLINDAMSLRNSLFPFHYTHAHYTRQTNESVITGFRDHPNQYLYGESFLVAPVTEPGAGGRLIYFPDAPLWYDYYTGETFEGGQTWFAETTRDKLPLFVKAGSVIPYRTEGASDHLKVEIYTGNAGAFRLVQDDYETRGYRETEAARTMFRYNEVQGQLKLTIGAVQAVYKGMTDRRTYELHFKYIDEPKSVVINGELVQSTSKENRSGTYSWFFDAEIETLIVWLDNISKDLKQDIVITPN